LQAGPEEDGEESLDEADEEELLVVLNFENCCVCFLLPHLGQAMGDLLDITSFSYGVWQSSQRYS
jgi:hypothetical protein